MGQRIETMYQRLTNTVGWWGLFASVMWFAAGFAVAMALKG